MRLLAPAHKKLAGIRKRLGPGQLIGDQLHWKKYPMERVLNRGLLFPKPQLMPRYQPHSSYSKYVLWNYVPTPEYRLVVPFVLAGYEIAFPGWL